jgi:hypothetical protein
MSLVFFLLSLTLLFSYLEVTQEEADQGKEVDMTFSVSYRYKKNMRTIYYA